MFSAQGLLKCNYFNFVFQGFGKPSLYHATVVIFLEFFAWGLLTSPMLSVSAFVFLDLVIQWDPPERPPLLSDHLTKILIGSSVSQISISETSCKQPPS